jgi:hypothetical protein
MEVLHAIGGHLLKYRYPILFISMLCILKSSYNVIRIVCIYCMYVLILFPHE